MTDREIMQQALEALEGIQWPGSPSFVKAAITALRERLEQPEQEPVALVVDGVLVKSELPEKYTGHLYTAPPQRKPLKLREIEKCIYDANNDPIVACRNVEAAHGIKENT